MDGIRTSWTDELIESELRKVSSSLAHFPSASQLRQINRNDLASIITKRGGFHLWASKLGMNRAHSDSDTGWDGEKMFVEQCHQVGIPGSRVDGIKSPFDILLDGCLRVDVKSARYAEYGACRGWFYRIAKIPQADLILLLQLDTGAFYGLPWFLCTTTNITVSRDGGMYADFANNWSLIREMIDRRKDEQDILAQKFPILNERRRKVSA